MCGCRTRRSRRPSASTSSLAILQNPFYPVNNSYTTLSAAGIWGSSGVGNLFMPGASGGVKSSYAQFPQGAYAYNPDRNNFAPALGVTWSPGEHHGALGAILGQE